MKTLAGRFACALILLTLLLTSARAEEAALSIGVTALEQDGNRAVIFAPLTGAQTAQAAPGAQEAAEPDARVAAVSALIEERFSQSRAATVFAQAASRGGQRIAQEESLYQDGRVASMGLIWQGEQADGLDGCSAKSLTLDLMTGAELTLGDLFIDADAAAARMEEIVSRDILPEISDYMEFADLLPVPRDCFWFDEEGLTVGYAGDRYRYFSGRSGTVHFAWFELADLIGEGSPLYALSRAQAADAQAIASQVSQGRFGTGMPYGVGDRLGDALGALTLLADPDYTTDSRVYLFERSDLRGFALEIPLYADTGEADTPVSAVRASRIAWHGLTTGATTREQVVSLLGEPQQTLVYDERDARDHMLDPGESLLYELGGRVLEAHTDESGVLRCLILRASFPERLY